MARRKKNRRYMDIVRDHTAGGQLVLIGILAALLLFGLIKLIGYGIDLISSRRTSDELQAIYHSALMDESVMVVPETTAPTVSTIMLVTSTPAPTETVLPVATPSPTQSPIPGLEKRNYPNNEKLQISSQFKTLRKESKYIVGWLTIHKMLDEAVVQRDDVYYLNHDALGNSNVNGALFLDSAISLKTRPYTYIIYGHNMKSGAMFGNLRNYENSTFYHNNPFITFDTMYETGRYVIFAVGTVSTEERNRNYADFYAMRSTGIQERQAIIDTLIGASVHTCTIDVKTDDQLLVLVTCVDQDEDRRVVVARRIRDDENEEDLKKQVEKSRKR